MKISFLFPTLSLLCLFAPCGNAQIVDNFSDGNFDQNPAWVGDAANFKVNAAGELQLNAAGAGQSTLLVSGNLPDSSIWDFDVRMTFDPSGSNLLRIYLQADQADPTIANGYYLELGETGSADAIRFFRQEGANKTQLAAGQAGLAASSPNLHIRATRSSAGNWTLEAAPLNAALIQQFSLQESTWMGGVNRFFGFQCVYTSSNATKFYFDNVNIRPDVPDMQAPVLVSAQASDGTHVSAFFEEALDPVTAEDPSHYTINNGIGAPLSALLSGDKKTVGLTLQNPLATGSYTLQTNGVKDLAGNASNVQTADFQYVKIEAATEFDILITEIMSDPSPSAGLPEVEWFEIYNRSAKVIDLATLRIADGSIAPVPLPTFLMEPGAYIALTAIANLSVLQSATSGKVLGAAISTSMLNNDGDVLSLSTANGTIIDRVSYTLDWHTVAGKEDGGFSLERINTNLPCLGAENWQSCPAQLGGTPAQQNASNSSDPDQTAPRLFKVFPESPSSLLLTFSEGMDRTSAEDISAYQLYPPVSLLAAQQLSTDRAMVRLTLATPLQVSTLYRLTIENSVEDCSGNPYLFTDTIYLGLAEKPDIQDIVINEILFNPASAGARYIECYNRSNKIFDWSEFFLASNSDSTTSIVKITQDRLFLPGEYHVFSNNAAYVRDQYAQIIKKNVLQNLLPSLDDNTDSIKLYWVKNGQTVTLDSFFYWRGMHNALLTTSEQEGVALERLRTDGPTQSPSNWSSASSLITGAPGTPTLPNSQALPAIQPEEDLISIPNARLSPDGDGYEDFLEIYYQLPTPGYAATLNIFDSDGNLVKNLVRQQLIGTNGTIRWDGDTDAGEAVKARPGVHVVYLEIFGPDGTVKRLKKPVALVGKF